MVAHDVADVSLGTVQHKVYLPCWYKAVSRECQTRMRPNHARAYLISINTDVGLRFSPLMTDVKELFFSKSVFLFLHRSILKEATLRVARPPVIQGVFLVCQRCLSLCLCSAFHPLGVGGSMVRGSDEAQGDRCSQCLKTCFQRAEEEKLSLLKALRYQHASGRDRPVSQNHGQLDALSSFCAQSPIAAEGRTNNNTNEQHNTRTPPIATPTTTDATCAIRTASSSSVQCHHLIAHGHTALLRARYFIFSLCSAVLHT